jgi:hypothetical protein
MRVAFGTGCKALDEKGNIVYDLDKIAGVPCNSTSYYSKEKFSFPKGFEVAFCPPDSSQFPKINGNWDLQSSDYFSALVVPCRKMTGIDHEKECASEKEIKENKRWITQTLIYFDQYINETETDSQKLI